jgi:aryl-phospho-beta-D-glucosidase BglC (GH1 family)
MKALVIALITIATILPQSLPAQKRVAKRATQAGVSEARFAKLRRGINTSHWFAQARTYTKEHLESHTTREDIKLIRSLGFDHIRLSIEPAPLWNADDSSILPADYLSHLDKAIDMILEEGLAVIVDIHPTDSGDFKKKLASEDRHVDAFARFWRALATHLSRRDPERVFLEAINEPVIVDPYRWYGIQAKLIAAIREAAPRHTIIATGHRWSSHTELLFLEPYADRNIVYNFHFYTPHVFTHQGATWGSPEWPYLKGVPYPSSTQAVSEMAASVENEQARKQLTRYGEAGWNPAKIEQEIAKVAAWAAKHRVRVTCNEFGVYRRFAPPGDRAAWLSDVRAALERHDIGWTMWDYAGGFSVVVKEGDRRLPDVGVVTALGLSRRSKSRGSSLTSSGR